MSGYVRSADFSMTFDGDVIACKLRPLSLPDLLRLQSTEVGGDEQAATVLASVVPSYVDDFQGPTAGDGTQISLKEMCESSYFLEVTMAMGRALLTASRPPRVPSSPSDT